MRVIIDLRLLKHPLAPYGLKIEAAGKLLFAAAYLFSAWGVWNATPSKVKETDLQLPGIPPAWGKIFGLYDMRDRGASREDGEYAGDSRDKVTLTRDSKNYKLYDIEWP